MDVIAKKTEELMDKATGIYQKSMGMFNKMVFLNEDQQDTINSTATTFEIYNKMVTSNIESIEESISNITDVKQVREIREAMERLKDQNMKDTAQKIAAGENVGIQQMQQFSKDLMLVRRGLDHLETGVSASFNDMVGMYAKQIISQSNSDKAQESHFRSLLISMNQQAKYLETQIEQMDKQKDLDENQLALLESHKSDLDKIKKFSADTAKFSKMGPDELKKQKGALDDILGQLSDTVFESKMFTTMNQVDNSIQSMSVGSERLNETIEDLTQAQMSGKEVIAGTAMQLKKGAKGMVSSMVLSSLGLGGLDEALGISEKFSELNLFGQSGLFGKKGMLSNIVGTVKGAGGALGGVGSALGSGVAVAGAGAAGYALGTGINKLIDKIGGEEDYLGATASRAIHGGAEREAVSMGDAVKKWSSMSNTVDGIDEALIDINNFMKVKEKGWTTKAEKQSIEHAKRMSEVLKRKRKKLERGDSVQDKNMADVDKEIEVSVKDAVEFSNIEPDMQASIIENENYVPNKMTDKVNVISTKVMGDQIVGGKTSAKVLENDVESIINKNSVTSESVEYLPKAIQDTTSMIIEKNQRENQRIVDSQKQQAPVVITPPIPPTPVDLNKSIDDPTLSVLNNDLFG